MPFVVAMGDGCFSMEEWLDLVPIVEDGFLVSGVHDLGLEWNILHLGFLFLMCLGAVDTCEGAAVVGDNEKVIKASMLSSLSSKVMERASKEFLKTVGVAGDEWHLVRVPLAELKSGADLSASNEALCWW